MHRIRTVFLGVIMCSSAVLAQSDAGDGVATSSQPGNQFAATNFYAEREREAWRDNAAKLAEIDAAYSAAVKELSDRNAQRLQAIVSESSAAHKDLGKQQLSVDERAAESKRIQAESAKDRQSLAAWYSQRRAEINAEHTENRAAQIAATNVLVERIGAERAATLQRMLDAPINPIGLQGLDTPAETDDSGQRGEQKSALTAEQLYRAHCHQCHGNPGTRESRYDLYEAVVVDDAAYFLDRVRNGPGQMPGIDEIQALTDGQVFSIRDFVRMKGDINTGVVEAPEPEKTPDPEGSDTGGPPATVAGGTAPSGLPPITPDSPLPDNAVPGGSAAARDAQTQSLGVASLTCNVSAGVEASWVAPFGWDAGWIPPGATMEESDVPWERAWMIRLEARLEDPTQTDSAGHPTPGWCTYTDGSLGHVAGENRRIVVFAHTFSQPFERFRFTGNTVEVWRKNTSPADRGGGFASDVVRTIHGIYLPVGTRQTSNTGEVHGNVKRIDDRWTNDRTPAFLVVEN